MYKTLSTRSIMLASSVEGILVPNVRVASLRDDMIAKAYAGCGKNEIK
jgi:hypothetical protein